MQGSEGIAAGVQGVGGPAEDFVGDEEDGCYDYDVAGAGLEVGTVAVDCYDD